MGVSIWEGSKAQALIDAIANNNKIDKRQGTANAGKALIVGNDGLVGLGSMGMSDEAKTALLNCFKNVAWINDNGQTYYDELERTLYGEPKTEPALLSWNYKMGGTPYDAGFLYRGSSGIQTTKPNELIEVMTDDGLKITHDGSSNNNVGYLVPAEMVNIPKYELEVDVIIKSLSTYGTWYGFGFYLKILGGTYMMFNDNGVCIRGNVVSSFKPSLNVPHTIRIAEGWLYCDNTAIVKVDSGQISSNPWEGLVLTKGSEQIIRRIEFKREGYNNYDI